MAGTEGSASVVVVPREGHPISRRMIDPDALRIMYRLRHEGFQAYLVGGAVRDFLRGERPKDFDIATDATPMELRRLFRNSRIIGRRFKLVHVFFGPKNIEVATLRRMVADDAGGDGADDGDPADDGEGDGSAEPAADRDLYVREDNLWGDVESDSWRRDFTINALYYRLEDYAIVDHTGGVADLAVGLVRSIGDPQVRFREDPVRMLRAIKFAARFGYRIEDDSAAAIRALAGEIHKASRFRVTEEIFRILTQANRHRGLAFLRDFGFLDHLFPSWMADIGPEGLEQVIEFFDAVEAEARQGRYLPLEVLAAGLFLPMLDTVNLAESQYGLHATELAAEVARIAHEMDLPRKLTTVVIALLKGQLYLLYFAGRGKSVQRFVRQPEFDWVWRLHDLAFGRLAELHPIQEQWLIAREALPKPLGGWATGPDQRDIFSFRGATGGGRHRPDEPRTIIDRAGGEHREGGTPRRRGRRRRR